MKNVLIILLIGFSTSCTVNKIATPDTILSFKGQIVGSIQKASRMDITKPIKAELTLMREDSTVISKFQTDENGVFNSEIKLSEQWNPLILKVKGLSDIKIDTTFNTPNKLDIVGYNLLCISTIASFQNITLDSEIFHTIIYDCNSEELNLYLEDE